jgi:hypothetical protein
MSANSTTSKLFDEAKLESASQIYECAMRCEDVGYDVVYVDKESDTGVLVEAHKTRGQWLDGDVVIVQIVGEVVSVTTPLRTIETDSVEDACEMVLWDLMREDMGNTETGQ